MTIQEDVIKPDPPSGEDMHDRGDGVPLEEATITTEATDTEATESTKESAPHKHKHKKHHHQEDFIIKPDAPSGEDMYDRGDEVHLEESTIATEATESTKETKESAPHKHKHKKHHHHHHHHDDHYNQEDDDDDDSDGDEVDPKHKKDPHHKKKMMPPIIEKPITENENRCCRLFWEGCVQVCVWSCICCCCESQ